MERLELRHSIGNWVIPKSILDEIINIYAANNNCIVNVTNLLSL